MTLSFCDDAIVVKRESEAEDLMEELLKNEEAGLTEIGRPFCIGRFDMCQRLHSNKTGKDYSVFLSKDRKRFNSGNEIKIYALRD